MTAPTVQYLLDIARIRGKDHANLLLDATQLMAFIKMKDGSKKDALCAFRLAMAAGLDTEELARTLAKACAEVGADPMQFAFEETRI